MRRSHAIVAAVDAGSDARAVGPMPVLRVRRLPRGAAPVLAATAAVAFACAALGLTPLRLAGLGGLAALVAGLLVHRRVTDRGSLDPVLVIGIGIGILVLTQGALTDLRRVTWASAAVLMAYPPLARGFARLFTSRLAGRRSDLFVQVGLAALATGVALSLLAAGHRGAAHHDVLLPIIVTALDIGVLTIAARLVWLPGERVATYRLLALAIACLLGAHLVVVMTLVWHAGHTGTVVQLLGMAAFVLFGAACLHPSAKTLEDPVDGDPPTYSPGHLTAVMIGTLCGPAVIGMHVLRHEAVSRPTAVGAALVAITMAAYTASLLSDRAAAEHRVQHDELTGLPNRTLLLDRIARAVAHARRSGVPISVMFIDLDRFKWVNDTLGHGAGDTLLRIVAQRLQETLRDEDTVARLGGDEFAVLLPRVSGLDGVITVAERVRDQFREPVDIEGEHFIATASIGVAMYPYDGEQPESLLASADAAMYRAKEAGRNTFEIYSPELASRAQERLALEAALLTAIERGELILHYQPVFDVGTTMVVGAEALVRWQHPEHGLIMPGEFVPTAEQSDLVVTLGSTVLAAACRQIAAWARDGMPPITVSVNVSARQLRHGIGDLVAANLRATGIEPERLVLELTETAAVDDVDHVAAALNEVRNMGVRWAIDDFGTGYCSLTYLSRLPVDSLKIDQSFVQSSAAADASIVTAIVAMAHGLGMTLVAEGVETVEQLRTLSALGCDRVQGYLLARPMPPREFEAFVRRQYGAVDPPVATGSALRVS